jgi:hypothetical protein
MKGTAVKLYLYLCRHADIQTGVCWPGYSRIKQDCNISSGSEILDAIESLSRAGLIFTWKENNKRYYQVL